MVNKFFLNLDYETPDDVFRKGTDALKFLNKRFGRDFAEERVGVKINEDMMTGCIDQRYRLFMQDYGCSIFADKKIFHGPDTGERIIERLHKSLPADYVTVSARLGTDNLKKYVEAGREYGMNIIAFTEHTKVSKEDSERMNKQPIEDVIYTLAQIASEAGCKAVVLEAEMLKHEKISELPIKKLVTGIRLDASDKGAQKRISILEDVKNLKSKIDYAAISSKYVSNIKELGEIIGMLI